MAVLDLDILKSLTSKYVFKLSDKKNEKLRCIICKNVLIDAFQGPCRCHYCLVCIRVYLENGNVFCPGLEEECKDDKLVLNVNVTRNASLNKEILKEIVNCPHDTCTFMVGWKAMSEHVEVCERRLIECPYLCIGCNYEKAPSDIILNHLNNFVLSHAQLLSRFLKTNINNAEASKLEIAKLKEESEMKTVEIRTLSEQNILIKNELENIINGLKSDMAAEGTDLQRGTTTDRQEFPNIKCQRSRSMILYKGMSRVLTAIDIGSTTSIDYNEMMFTITKFSERKAAKESVFSPYFYSHTNGYKLRLHVYPGGRLLSTHLSMYFIVCKGEYDDNLSWPFNCPFTISIVNNRTGQIHHSESHRYADVNYNGSAFKKPTDRDNNGYEYPQFINSNDLQPIIGYSDCLVIKCRISAPE